MSTREPAPGGPIDTSDWIPLTDHPNSIRISPHLPADVMQMLRKRKLLIWIARNSSDSGKAARDSAITNLGSGGTSCLNRGLDLRPAMPSAEEALYQLLHKAEVVPSEEDFTGKRFKNSYVVFDKSAQGVIILLSIGPASKLDKQQRQPFVGRVADLVRRYEPAVVFTHVMDRMMRTDWEMQPLITAMKQLARYRNHTMFLADGYEEGFHTVRPGQSDSIIFMVKASGYAQTAAQLPFTTRSGMVTRSGSRMVGGRVRLHTPHWLPHGFASFWVSWDSGELPQHFAVVNTPTARFDCPDGDVDTSDESARAAWTPPMILSGPPLVRDADGNVVDMAACVSWYLSNLGKPDMPKRLLRAELVARGYTSHGLQRKHGRNAAALQLGAPEMGNSALDSIDQRLEVYEKGILKLRLGVPGVPEAIVIYNCFPPEGRWASPSDFKRIRENQREWRSYRGGSERLQLEKVPVLLGGRPGSLQRTFSDARLRALAERPDNDPDWEAAERMGYASLGLLLGRSVVGPTALTRAAMIPTGSDREHDAEEMHSDRAAGGDGLDGSGGPDTPSHELQW